jgi:uncharacterized protein YecT (DUF1311 family)
MTEDPSSPGLDAACPDCGQLNRPGARFCRDCGRPLELPVAETHASRRSWIGPAAWVSIGTAVVAVLAMSAIVAYRFGILDKALGHGAALSAAAPAAPAGQAEPINTMVSWDSAKDGDPKTYAIDGLSLTLASRAQATGGPIPVLHVAAPDGRAFDVTGDAGLGGTGLNFGVGRLDPAGDGSQVIVAGFTGGAHCCDHVGVLELGSDGWRLLDVGSFEGDTLGDFPKDVDGDGTPDLVMSDDRFAYAFSYYADSYMPPRVFNILHGAVVDVSAQPRYAKLFRQDMKGAQDACMKHSNGGCAAFVADASRLGLHDWAWRIMLANYDATASWSWPTQCLVAAAAGACPKDQQQSFSNLPDALQAFLTQTGYVVAARPPAEADATGPSFDCAGASTAVIRLVCNTPGLAQADRDLSSAYSQAMARVPDPTRLRDEQRRWIARRAAVPASIDTLTALYAQRIQELQAEGVAN